IKKKNCWLNICRTTLKNHTRSVTMVRKHATIAFLLLFSLNSFAELEAPMKFTGQNVETVKLEKILKVTRSVQREVPGTCERQVPNQE
ncbi:MAG: hypothetical protein ACJ75J_18600, partial [Cytophagaceae bacterium]